MPQPADLPDETEIEIDSVALAGSGGEEATMSPVEIARPLGGDGRGRTPRNDRWRAGDDRGRSPSSRGVEKARFLQHGDRLRDAWE